MKRIALHFGASCAVALLFANVLGTSAAVYISIAAGVLFIISLLISNIRQALTIPIVTGAVMLSCLLFVFVWNNTVTPVQSLDGQRVYCTFQIVDIPQKTGSGYLYTVKTVSLDKKNTVQNFKAKVFSVNEIEADYYDDVSAFLTFEKAAANGFDSYGDFGENIFIRACTDFNDAVFTYDESTSKPLNYHFIRLREKIKKNTAYVTDGDEGALALALLIGDKSELSDETLNNFRISGVYHIMAVSGIHTSVICLGIYYILKRLRVPLLPTTLLTFCVLLSYLAVADFSRSVVRSVVTVSVFIFARLINKKADRLNSLGAAITLLCLNPFAVTDPSAVLTVCAVFGITCVKPELDKICKPKSEVLKYILNGLTLTGSVMMTTLPAVMIFFSSVSLIGFVTNFIILPFAEISLVSALLFNLFHFSVITAFLPKWIMILSSRVMIYVTSFLADKFGRFYINMSDIMFFISVSLCLLFCAIGVLIFKRISIKQLCIFMIFAFAISGTCVNYSNSRSVFMNVSGYEAVAVYNDDCIIVIDADNKNDYYTVRRISMLNDFEKAVFLNCDYDKQRLKKLFNGDVQFYSSEELDIDLCTDIGVKCYDSRIDIYIFGNVVNVYDDCVLVGDYTAFRNVSYKFSDGRDYVFKFCKNKITQVRREDNG